MNKAQSLLAPGPPSGWRAGTYSFHPDDGRFTWCPGMLALYGRNEAPASEAEFYDLVHPDERVQVETEGSAILRSGASTYIRSFRVGLPDGSIRTVLDRGAVERDASGRVTLVQGMHIDITDDALLEHLGQRRSGASAKRDRLLEIKERLRESEARHRTLFEAIDAGFCIVEVRFDRPDGRTDYRVVEANPAFYTNTGFPRHILGKWLREAAPDLEEHWYEIYGSVARTGEPRRFVEHSEMLGRWFDVYAFRIDAPEDRHVAILFGDITERKTHEEHVQFLMRELSHRSKNMMSLVQVIARQTASSGLDDFTDRFGRRIQALASAQDLLEHGSWRSVRLADLVKSQLAHFKDLLDGRILVDGPDTSVGADAAQAIGMALHELATNAAKYGALSNETGEVSVTWSLEDPGLVLCWKERGGPPVEKPDRQGFGSKVTTGMVAASTDGDVDMDYAAEGLCWTLRCGTALSEAHDRP